MLRELREEDAAQVAALFVTAFGEARRLDAEEIRSWLRNEELKPEWLRVLEDAGRVVGYGDVWIKEDGIELDVAAPGHWGPFFDWAEALAKERGAPSVRSYFPAGHELAQLVEQRGYRLARSSYTMEIDVPEAPPPPGVPGGLDLRAYREGADEAAVRDAVNEAFAEDWHFDPVTEPNFREFYLKARGFDPSLWLIAWDGDDVAGFALAYGEHVGEKGLGWIGTLGVRPRWRRQGLGEALLRAAFGELHSRGRRRVGLGVDAENVTGALRLYERVGMRVIRQGDNWVLEL